MRDIVAAIIRVVLVFMMAFLVFGCANQTKTDNTLVQPAPIVAPTVQPALVVQEQPIKVDFWVTLADFVKSGAEVILAAAVVFVFLAGGCFWATMVTIAVVIMFWKVAIGAVIALMSLLLQRYWVQYKALVVKCWTFVVARVKSLFSKKLVATPTTNSK